MKKTHIVLFLLVVAAVAVIVSMFGDFSTYETFASASQVEGKQYHVMGELVKDKEMVYDPIKDPNHFEFYVTDKSGAENKVVFSGAKPTDIEKSEQIVMTGYMNDGTFHCSKIQMKCPSKYENDQIAVANN